MRSEHWNVLGVIIAIKSSKMRGIVKTTESIHPLLIFNITSTTRGKKSKLQMYEILLGV